MLAQIHELIIQLQSEIGNGAKVRLLAESDRLEFFVDWERDDFHAFYPIKGIDFHLDITEIARWFKNAYAKKGY